MGRIVDLLPAPARPYAKALVAFAGSVVGALLLVWDGGVTSREALEVAAVVLGVTGMTYQTPNR